MAVTQDVVMNFLLEQGGKVKNSDLLKKFKPVVDSPDPLERANNRDLFKRFVNNVAVVRDEDGYKVVVLKKKYTHLLEGFVQSADTQEEGETQSKGDLQEEAQTLPGIDNITDEPSISTECDMSAPQDLPDPHHHSPAEEPVQESTVQEELSHILLPVKEPEDEEKKESVFDIWSRLDNSGTVPVPRSWSDGQSKEMQKPHMLPLRYAPMSDSLDSSELLEVPMCVVQESTPLDLLQTAPPLTFQEAPSPALPRSPHVGRRHIENAGSKSPHMKRVSKTMKASEENKYSDVVPLVQHEHEWLVCSTNGRWNHKLLGLMLVDGELADKRDFISGFTALHWAAKSGNTEMVKLLFDQSTKAGASVNVNVRSFGGYTPLHIAAIHERKDVIVLLVGEFRADVHIRDNSGRKPYHYLKKGSDVQLRRKLKDPASFNQDNAMPTKRNSKVAASILGTTNAFFGVIADDAALHDLTRGLKKHSSINKFFTAPTGVKKKLKARDSYPSMSSLCEEPQEVEEIAGKRRPVSEYFAH